jgi:hypothetical protein
MGEGEGGGGQDRVVEFPLQIVKMNARVNPQTQSFKNPKTGELTLDTSKPVVIS